jgi:hypothetical protein
MISVSRDPQLPRGAPSLRVPGAPQPFCLRHVP